MNRTDHDPGKKEAAAERRAKAFELRRAGLPYRGIARELGISEKTAHQDVQRVLAGLAEIERQSAEEYRALELDRLGELQVEATRILRQTHPLISGGKVLSGFTSDGKPFGLTDPAPKLAAIDRLLRISESRRKLLGLDAPTQIAPVNPDGTPYEAAYMELRAVLIQVLPVEARMLLAGVLETLDAESPDSRSDDGA
jgi:hypothetical protein